MLPDLPLELWHRILSFTCTEGDDDLNCNTPLALSRTCRALRRVSRYHRYHSVTIRGWEHLLAFEEQLNSHSTSTGRPGEETLALIDNHNEGLRAVGHSGIVHLNVEIEELRGVAYPDGDEDVDEDTSDDTYVPSSDSEEEGDEDMKEGNEDADGDENDELDGPCGSESLDALGVQSSGSEDDEVDDSEDDEDALMEEQAHDFAEISDFELAEFVSDAEAIAEEKHVSLLDSEAQLLSHLQGGRPTALARIEFRVFSALRRLLLACAPTLEVLTLRWKPRSTFFLEAVFPTLPRLRRLIWDSDKEGCRKMTPISCERETPAPVVFPVLQHLDIKAESNARMVEDLFLLGPGVPKVSAPQVLLPKVALPVATKEVYVCVGPAWEWSLGQLDGAEVGRLYPWPNAKHRSVAATYYAVPRTKAQHLKALLKQLAHFTQEMIEDGTGDDDPNLQHGIDVCIDLKSRLGCE
ncbi:hypothetical protein H1R20_g9307, partial [Candolleomyces eurysporus]